MIKKILGFFGQNNQWTHDHSFALSENGQITDYIQLERLTRKKFDNSLPDKLVSILNDTNNLKYELNNLEIGYVNTFALDSNFFKKADNNIISTNKDIEFTAKGSSLLEPVEVTGKISGEKVDATIIPHELAHVFSLVPFYGLFKNNSLLIHVDGAASICNASAWVFRNNHIQLLEKTSIFHHALLNFSYNDLTFDMLKIPKTKHFSMPGKLMGFASYGTVSTEMLSWLKERDFFRDYSEHPKTQLLNEAQKMFQYNLKTLETRHTFSYNIAACMQKHFEDEIFSFIRKHQMSTGCEYLYYAGGAALNIKLNSELVNSKIFKEVFIPPPAGDSGLSLGVIAYLNWKKGIKLINSNAYLNNVKLTNENDPLEFSIDDVCKLLKNGKVIGLYTGNGEAGPRALGHRSLLANPTIKKMKRIVSIDIKGREWYRPLAPIVLETEMEDLFEDYQRSEIMKYMLYEFKVKDRVKNLIPAVVHIDGTSRAQIVMKNDPDLVLVSEMLQTMSNEYNIPCLINTSFNSAGEPIVHTKEEAISTAKAMGLNGVILENHYIHLRD